MTNCAAPPTPENRLSLDERVAYTTVGIKKEETLTYNVQPILEISTPQGMLWIDIYDTLHDWFNDVLSKLVRFLYFETNWDSYGGQKIGLKSVAAALKVLSIITDRETPKPDVIPTSDGSVQLEWSENGIELEVEIITPTKIGWNYEEIASGFIDEGEEAIYNGLRKLKGYVERLTI